MKNVICFIPFFKYPKICGRLQIDMYTYFCRDFNLSSYKVDDVAGQYVSNDVKFSKHKTMDGEKLITKLYTNNITGLHVSDFIHIKINGFTRDYYKEA